VEYEDLQSGCIWRFIYCWKLSGGSDLIDKLAYCVIDTDTMEIKSKFYKRKGDAKAYVPHQVNYCDWIKHDLAIAEFEYKQHYVLEEE